MGAMNLKILTIFVSILHVSAYQFQPVQDGCSYWDVLLQEIESDNSKRLHCIPDQNNQAGIVYATWKSIPAGKCPFFDRYTKQLETFSCDISYGRCPNTSYPSYEASRILKPTRKCTKGKSYHKHQTNKITERQQSKKGYKYTAVKTKDIENGHRMKRFKGKRGYIPVNTSDDGSEEEQSDFKSENGSRQYVNCQGDGNSRIDIESHFSLIPHAKQVSEVRPIAREVQPNNQEATLRKAFIPQLSKKEGYEVLQNIGTFKDICRSGVNIGDKDDMQESEARVQMYMTSEELRTEEESKDICRSGVNIGDKDDMQGSEARSQMYMTSEELRTEEESKDKGDKDDMQESEARSQMNMSSEDLRTEEESNDICSSGVHIGDKDDMQESEARSQMNMTSEELRTDEESTDICSSSLNKEDKDDMQESEARSQMNMTSEELRTEEESNDICSSSLNKEDKDNMQESEARSQMNMTSEELRTEEESNGCCMVDDKVQVRQNRRRESRNEKGGKSTVKGISGSGDLSRGRHIKAQKYMVKKRSNRGLPPNQKVQISGHKIIQSLNSYSSINTNQSRAISDILSSCAATTSTENTTPTGTCNMSNDRAPVPNSPVFSLSQTNLSRHKTNAVNLTDFNRSSAIFNQPIYGGTFNISINKVSRKLHRITYSSDVIDLHTTSKPQLKQPARA